MRLSRMTFLDSTVNVKGKSRSLKQFLFERIREASCPTKPTKLQTAASLGKELRYLPSFLVPPAHPRPSCQKRLLDFLGWPLLAIDPSHLLRNGMDGIQAEANAIFRMLEETERVVVLFDEFDEFVRERGSSDAEQFSRLLTTAMLPKLASIHKRRTLVFIIATNNIQQFDLAIQRPGRFDRVVQSNASDFRRKNDQEELGSLRKC